MADKFDVYDTLGMLIPGILTVCLVAILFPSMTAQPQKVHFPDAFAAAALLSLSLFIGHIVQALSSIVEPVLYATWGGRPSEKALTDGLGDRYLPKDSAERIRKFLISCIDGEASDRSLFLFAAQRAEGNGRVCKFNSLYAYHRALLTTSMLILIINLVAFRWGFAATWPLPMKLGVFALTLAMTLLFWHRTKQRALYYVREVLLTAEHVLDGRITASSDIRGAR